MDNGGKMKISYKFIRKIKKINILLNGIICLAIILLTKGNLLYVICGYCITDIVLTISNKIFETYLVNMRTKEKDDSRKILDQFYDSPKEDKQYIQSLVKKILDKQQEYQQLQEKIQHEQEELERQTRLTSVRGLERIITTIDDYLVFYEEFQSNNKLNGKKTLKDITKRLSSIKAVLVETKPEASQIISGTFHIYLNDFMKILTDCNNMPDSEDREEKIKEVLGEMLKYITILEDDIMNFQVEDVTVSINVLLQELRKENADN